MAVKGDYEGADRQRRYRATAKGKAAADRYNASPKRTADCRRYTVSAKGKASRKKYKKSEGGIRAIRRYHETENGKYVFRNAQLKFKTGMTIPDKLDALARQGGKCACCGTTEPGSKKGWHTDHCHITKCFRGVLCHHCNLMLGHAKDDPVRLQAGIDYLERA